MKHKLYPILFLMLFISCKHVKKTPYKVTEKVSEELTYTQEKGEWSRENGILGLEHPRLKANCYVTNTSAYDGTFNVHFIFSSQGEKIDFISTMYVRAGERKSFSVNRKINHFTFENNVECSVEVKPPVILIDKEVTKYSEEEYYSLF